MAEFGRWTEALCAECGAPFRKFCPDYSTPVTCSRSCATKFGNRKKTHTTLREQFERHFEKTTGCWLWQSAIFKDTGYGKMNRRGTCLLAHRVSWGVYRGPVPDGLQVLHSCDVRRCVRPEHLFVGTQSDNMIDCAQKGRLAVQKRRGLRLEESNA